METKEYLLSKINNNKILMWSFVVLAAFTAYFSILISEQKGKVYYLFLLLIIPFAIIAFLFRKNMLKYKALYQIKNSWGRKDDRKRNFKDIRKLFDYIKALNNDQFIIDNQTWEDLTMDRVFEAIDKTLSSPGEQMLYNVLRTPKFKWEDLEQRKLLLKFFKENKEIREKISIELYYLGRQRNNSITDLLYGELPRESKVSIMFNIMALLPIILAATIPFIGLRAVFYIVLVFIANMYISYKFKNEISAYVDAMSFLSAIVNTGKKIGEIKSGGVKYYADILKNDLKDIKASKSAAFIGNNEIDVIVQYFNILFLTKERKFFSVLEELKKHRQQLRSAYQIIGELDAMISIASYREEIKNYTEPEFISDGRALEINSVIHPLIENPVPNSITINNKGILLTGSNMSGKSTFLRTIGVNVLFAQTILTCLSHSYKANYFKLLSSISPNDNILQGKSYYLDEAEAVLRIIKSCEDQVPSLCIIDEIFRGTNPIERIAASAEILEYLIKNNSIPIVATHDLELTEVAKTSYECYYFTESVGEKGLEFDYLIRKGVSPTRNAIKLLKFLGYPDSIINSTYNRIDRLFEK